MSKNAKIVLICSIIGALTIGAIVVALVLRGKGSGKAETSAGTEMDLFGRKKEATELRDKSAEYPERKTEAVTEAKTEKATESFTEQTEASKKPVQTSDAKTASLLK